MLNLLVTVFCSDLDPALQHELRQYLAARGIEEKFTNSLLLHLHKKEQNQYMDWLQKLKDIMVEHEWCTQILQPHFKFPLRFASLARNVVSYVICVQFPAMMRHELLQKATWRIFQKKTLGFARNQWRIFFRAHYRRFFHRWGS